MWKRFWKTSDDKDNWNLGEPKARLVQFSAASRGSGIDAGDVVTIAAAVNVLVCMNVRRSVTCASYFFKETTPSCSNKVRLSSRCQSSKIFPFRIRNMSMAKNLTGLPVARWPMNSPL